MRNVGTALLSLRISLAICVQSIQLIKLRYTSALIVHTPPNVVLKICEVTSELTLERNLFPVRNVGSAFLIILVSLIICVLSIQLIKLRYTSALIVHTLPNIVIRFCNVTSELTLESNLTYARNVVKALLIILVSLIICVLSILLVKLRYTSALIVHTLPNIVLKICEVTSELTLERSHTLVRNVIVTSPIILVSLIICVQSIQLIKLRYTSVLIVHTLPNIVLVLCEITSVLTLDRSHTHVIFVGSASPGSQLVIGISGECIDLVSSSLSASTTLAIGYQTAILTVHYSNNIIVIYDQSIIIFVSTTVSMDDPCTLGNLFDVYVVQLGENNLAISKAYYIYIPMHAILMAEY